MAKKALINRELKRQALAKKFAAKVAAFFAPASAPVAA